MQDTVPRAGLSALHARLEGVGPSSWEDPALVQVWFRCADYVLPAADLAVFTLGALPRDPERAAALDAFAAAVGEVLDGRPLPTREVVAALPPVLALAGQSFGRDAEHALSMLLRGASVAGRYRIRWDARTVTVIPAERPDTDPEATRLELARRFLGWHGPATDAVFARWAGVSRRDAAETWARLAPELVPVDLEGRARQLLARDEEALAGAQPPPGVRFLPMGDPLWAVDRGLVGWDVVGVPAPTCDERGTAITSRLVNSLGGRILVDGRIEGAWGREQARMAIHLWRPAAVDVDRVLAEAAGFAGPIGAPIRVRRLN
ncbi:MAG TPA: crosslink repair DNA glycosylase YcaQ family protein [Candidatus Dormibacteraeota bacterium]|nr:crosslink repair DNA glycosylase YcaQ family protein [Candidatus Dormibacteraeota bacterium]